MVRPEYSPQFVNRIINSDAVRPFVDYRGAPGDVDMSPAVGWFTQTGIVWLSNGEDALACFPLTGEREFQAHLFFDRTCRGKRALEISAEMLAWLKPYADRIWGAIPVGAKHTLLHAHMLGFVDEGDADFEEGRVRIVAKRLN